MLFTAIMKVWSRRLARVLLVLALAEVYDVAGSSHLCRMRTTKTKHVRLPEDLPGLAVNLSDDDTVNLPHLNAILSSLVAAKEADISSTEAAVLDLNTQVCGGHARWSSCSGQCGRLRFLGNLWRCNCDQECVRHGDCCVDYWTECGGAASGHDYYHQHIATPPAVADAGEGSGLLLDSLTAPASVVDTGESSLAEELRCVQTPGNARVRASRANSMRGTYMVSRCPVTYTGDSCVRARCEDPLDGAEDGLEAVVATEWLRRVMPVEAPADHASATSTTYRNLYCAACHGANVTRAWPATVQCPSAQVPRQLFAENDTRGIAHALFFGRHCSVTFRARTWQRPCLPTALDECRPGAQGSLRAACRAYTNFVLLGRGVTFKNPHCALCAGVYPSSDQVEAGGPLDAALTAQEEAEAARLLQVAEEERDIIFYLPELGAGTQYWHAEYAIPPGNLAPAADLLADCALDDYGR